MHPGLQRHQGVILQGPSYSPRSILSPDKITQICAMDLGLRGAQVEFPNRVSNGHVIKSGCPKDYASEKP